MIFGYFIQDWQKLLSPEHEPNSSSQHSRGWKWYIQLQTKDTKQKQLSVPALSFSTACWSFDKQDEAEKLIRRAVFFLQPQRNEWKNTRLVGHFYLHQDSTLSYLTIYLSNQFPRIHKPQDVSDSVDMKPYTNTQRNKTYSSSLRPSSLAHPTHSME